MRAMARVLAAVADAESDADLRKAQAQARAIIASDRAAEIRKRAKRAPRLKAVRASKAQRRENLATTRAVVIARAGGLCEACCGEHGCHLHHLFGGSGNRRRYEGPNAVVWLCVRCHHEAHRGDPSTLALLADKAQGIGAPDIVQAALHRRLQKVTG